MGMAILIHRRMYVLSLQNQMAVVRSWWLKVKMLILKTMEVSNLMRHSFLAANGLYEHQEGNLKGKRTEKQFEAVFVYPDSPVAYASGLIVPAPALKPQASESAANPLLNPVLQPERPEEFAVKLLDDLPPAKTLTVEELNRPDFDLSQYNDIDASVVQYLWDHYEEQVRNQDILWELSRLSQDPTRFRSLNNLSDPAMARAAVMLGTGFGEIPETPWNELKTRTPCWMDYTGKVETVAAAQELTRHGDLEGGYRLILTQEPSLEVAQVLGRVNLVYLRLNFFPSREVLTALAPKQTVVVNLSVQTASQIEPLVEWLGHETWPPKYLAFNGTVPKEVQQALTQRFPEKFRSYDWPEPPTDSVKAL